jgi:hypothetical protein
MQAMINLVATRQKAGKPAELLRWYNDHVNLLMGFENLKGATLYRRTSADTAAAPDYVCLYDFPDASTFAAFEASDAKERARQVTASGWGRQGIEIIQRTQYTNGGKWTGQTSNAESGCHIQCLDMTPSTSNAAPEADLKRWLADTLHEAAAKTGVGHYEWYVSGRQQAIVLAGAGAASARLDPAWHTWWDASATEPLGQPPSAVTVCWQAGYERVSAWRR